MVTSDRHTTNKNKRARHRTLSSYVAPRNASLSIMLTLEILIVHLATTEHAR